MNYGDKKGRNLYMNTQKSDSGIRIIPLMQKYNTFQEQMEINRKQQIPYSKTLNGYSGFLFVTKTGLPYTPIGFYCAVKRGAYLYNLNKIKKAEKEKPYSQEMTQISHLKKFLKSLHKSRKNREGRCKDEQRNIQQKRHYGSIRM